MLLDFAQYAHLCIPIELLEQGRGGFDCEVSGARNQLGAPNRTVEQREVRNLGHLVREERHAVGVDHQPAPARRTSFTSMCIVRVHLVRPFARNPSNEKESSLRGSRRTNNNRARRGITCV